MKLVETHVETHGLHISPENLALTHLILELKISSTKLSSIQRLSEFQYGITPPDAPRNGNKGSRFTALITAARFCLNEHSHNAFGIPAFF